MISRVADDADDRIDDSSQMEMFLDAIGGRSDEQPSLFDVPATRTT
jgi:hypothetical protein